MAEQGSNRGVTKQFLLSAGAKLIAEERDRQVKEEGWSSEHDDRHVHGELACAAAVYATPGVYVEHVRSLWPRNWNKFPPYVGGDDKPRIRELVKAGALVAAEIDRLLRLEAKHGGSQG